MRERGGVHLLPQSVVFHSRHVSIRGRHGELGDKESPGQVLDKESKLNVVEGVQRCANNDSELLDASSLLCASNHSRTLMMTN
jgi:hypothetical protein